MFTPTLAPALPRRPGRVDSDGASVMTGSPASARALDDGAPVRAA